MEGCPSPDSFSTGRRGNLFGVKRDRVDVLLKPRISRKSAAPASTQVDRRPRAAGAIVGIVKRKIGRVTTTFDESARPYRVSGHRGEVALAARGGRRCGAGTKVTGGGTSSGGQGIDASHPRSSR